MASPRVAIVAAAALLCGCTTTSERLYYQTRYLPEGGEALYASSQRSGWSGDDEVYELPSHPPGDDHVARRNCLPPGVRFKPEPIFGIRDTGPDGPSVGPAQVAGNWDPRPVPVDQLPPDYVLPAGAQRAEDHGPALVNRMDQPAGAFDPRARSRTGAGVGLIPATPAGAQRNQDKWDYCLDPQLPPPAPVKRDGE